MNGARKRFDAKHVPDPSGSGCWLWTAAAKPGPRGEPYGSFSLNGKNERAHRASFMLYRGPIPEGLCVLHECDTPMCVNPAHLFLGTRADNNRDRHLKGRSARGVRLPQHRLTPGQVKAIRADTASQHRELARRYGVHETTILAIRRRETWRHL